MANYDVVVRVMRPDDTPYSGARVSLEIFQFLAGGFLGNQHTDSEGYTRFRFEADQFADVVVWVQSEPKTDRAGICSSYGIVSDR